MRAADLIAFDRPAGAHLSNQSLVLARQNVKESIEALQDTLTLFDERSLLAAAKAILSAKHVFLFGSGMTAPLVHDAYQRFLGSKFPLRFAPMCRSWLRSSPIPGRMICFSSF